MSAAGLQGGQPHSGGLGVCLHPPGNISCSQMTHSQHHDSSEADHKRPKRSWTSLLFPQNRWNNPPSREAVELRSPYKLITTNQYFGPIFWDRPHFPYGICILRRNPAFTLLLPALEFSSVQSQGTSLGGPPRNTFGIWPSFRASFSCNIFIKEDEEGGFLSLPTSPLTIKSASHTVLGEDPACMPPCILYKHSLLITFSLDEFLLCWDLRNLSFIKSWDRLCGSLGRLWGQVLGEVWLSSSPIWGVVSIHVVLYCSILYRNSSQS